MSIKKYILLMFEIWFHFYPAFTSNDARDVHTGDGNRKPIDEGTPIRLTTHGRIRGYFLKSGSTTAEVYEGVPYARPPVGNLRFRAPFPPEPWNGTFDCGRQKMKNCIEFWFRESTGNESEDCLYMNIVVPYATRKSTESENSTQLYPILIWVHGGSFQVGGASIYPLDNIVQNFASRSVIFVAINYRLGPLGFLTAGHRDLHGNYGLDDQIEAIRWMKANALNFDGDPNQITIGGENAGAASVSILAISPKTKGLFAAAILRSGSSLAPWAVRPASTENNSARLIYYCKCRYNSSLGIKHIADCMRTVNVKCLRRGWQYVASANAQHSGDGVYMANTYFTPSIDTFRIEDSVLPGEPSAVIKEGARVPVMLGVTSGEAGQLIALSMRGTDFVRSSGELNLDGIISPRLYTNYKQVQRVVEERYSGGNMQVEEENEIRNLFTRISTDHNFKAPAAREALFYASNHLTVYAYIFHKENAELMQRVYSQGMKGVGAVHGNDCVYIFNATILSDPSVKRVDWSEEDEKLRQRLTQQMVDFTRKPSLMNSDFEPFTALHRIATPIYGPHHSPPEEFFTNISNFWYGTVRSVELLPLEPEYKVLLQSCTMCGYPYKVPFYIMLSIMIVLLVALAVFFFRRQFVQKAVLYKLAAITSDGFRKA